jgi:hypothetical protein
MSVLACICSGVTWNTSPIWFIRHAWGSFYKTKVQRALIYRSPNTQVNSSSLWFLQHECRCISKWPLVFLLLEKDLLAWPRFTLCNGVAVDVPPPFYFFKLVQMHFFNNLWCSCCLNEICVGWTWFLLFALSAVKGDLRRPSYGPSWQMQPVDDVAKGARFWMAYSELQLDGYTL